MIPQPIAQQALPDETFTLLSDATIGVDDSGAQTIADRLAAQLRRSTGFALPVQQGTGTITLSANGPESLGAEGYELRADASGVTITAATAEGLFRGVTTLRQLLPAKAEADSEQEGPWEVAGTTISDSPRYGYRGVMLDVSRHFFTVEQVKHFIDLVSLYKINRLHLHLSDDQGWRIQVDTWPRLTEHGGSQQVGGGAGGYYTKADYADLVRYAAEHYITVVPEIDTPGHTNAALASYPELNKGDQAPDLYTETEVGFSSLTIDKDVTYAFLDDVFREVAEQTPGDLLHLGGDEAHSTPHSEYLAFVPKAAELVVKYGKRVMGWHEIADGPLPAGTVVQYWGTEDPKAQVLAQQAVEQGATLVLSPANRAYLDMKYHEETPLGLQWAGLVSVEQSYSWNPATLLPNVPASAIDGVEAPLWTETLDDLEKVEFMVFPRLPGIAELGWSPESALDWTTYRDRLAEQGPRWEVLGVNFYRAPEIDWR
ncbi:beta-N-acetylhexosaminidase [Kribbella speibonae]|uniref:beta-N-acetylhexosaminidase n=1 Tax=Kribbella speibonae TaxID=1572660 RepID=A0A4R0IKG5_9ACTN|nr:beta-N-acetylhexosaminidase [Kribbella speibonae]TCC24952.1 beta-N-acetylhexosaminidase [Kribbella speibonae]TCC32770.1 beta-N-acetylhexosaminidase [Kribbella speibonae]